MNREHFRILIVDDEPEQIETLSFILNKQGYSVKTCSNAITALKELELANFDLLITDYIMAEMNGIDLLLKVKKIFPETEVIIITGYGTIQDAVRAMQIGAFTYVIKGNPVEELLTEVDKLFSIKKLRRNSYLRESPFSEFMLETRNKEFREILRVAEKSATTNCPVLLLGESGVGKEIIARLIHQLSQRSSDIFMPINCHAIPESLLEAELFGYEKGAFTGAAEARIGKMEAAEGGTLFLDEIGELPLSAQSKLLRVLETKTIERIGSNRQISLDFRLICATNRHIEEEKAIGNFREDLFYRIGTITMTIPPLRNRKEDLRMLIDFFFQKTASEQKKGISLIEPEVYEFLESYSYPGNIRELKNLTERLCVLSENGIISNRDLPPGKKQEIAETREHPGLIEFRKNREAEYICEMLENCQHNITAAAKKLGISRRQLFNKIQEYNIN